MIKNKLLGTTAITALALTKMAIPSVANADSSSHSGTYVSFGGEIEDHDITIKQNASNIPTAAVYSAAVSTTAASNFVGFNAGALTIIGRAASTLANDETTTNAVLQAGHYFPVNDKFLMGLSAKVSTGGDSISKNGEYTLSTITHTTLSAAIVNTSGVTKHQVEDNHYYGVEINPAIAVNNKLMVYGSLGYGITNRSVKTTYEGTAITKSEEDDLETFSYGLGLRYNPNESNFFIDVNASYKDVDDITTKNNDSGTAVTSGTAGTLTNTDNADLTNTFAGESYSLGIKIGTRF